MIHRNKWLYLQQMMPSRIKREIEAHFCTVIVYQTGCLTPVDGTERFLIKLGFMMRGHQEKIDVLLERYPETGFCITISWEADAMSGYRIYGVKAVKNAIEFAAESVGQAVERMRESGGLNRKVA